MTATVSLMRGVLQGGRPQFLNYSPRVGIHRIDVHHHFQPNRFNDIMASSQFRHLG